MTYLSLYALYPYIKVYLDPVQIIVIERFAGSLIVELYSNLLYKLKSNNHTYLQYGNFLHVSHKIDCFFFGTQYQQRVSRALTFEQCILIYDDLLKLGDSIFRR